VQVERQVALSDDGGRKYGADGRIDCAGRDLLKVPWDKESFATLGGEGRKFDG
jgi:hypothetical protein